MAYNNITGSLPEDWSPLRGQLTYLGLDHNAIDGTIPHAIAGLAAVTVLALHKKRHTGFEPALLPFENYTGWCYLQDPTSPTNHSTCPLPPDSAACAQGPPTCSCTGSSTSLAPAECAWWINLYDTTGGSTDWTNCRGNRTDPCSCSYTVSGYSYGVTCTGGHIAAL
jgi:hypothetical protein